MKHNLIESTLEFKSNKYKIASIDLGDHPSFHGFNFDEVETRNQLWNINPGDYVFDVGASYGSYTMTALACGAEKVYTWSPQSHGYLSEKIVLEESLKLNNWQDKCTIYDTGVYSKSGWLDCFTLQFYAEKPNYVKNSITNATSDLLKVDTLDNWYINEFLPNNKNNIKGKTIWMKLDVEAAELEVVKGAERLIRELSPIIFIENHECLRPGIDLEFKNLMKEMFSYKEIIKVPYHTRSHSIYTKI